MKTINAYTNYCTQEQTNRAIKLGCPCESPEDYSPIKLPTTQQMIGWLREKGYYVESEVVLHEETQQCFSMCIIHAKYGLIGPLKSFNTYNHAELAAIDAALDYIEKLDAPSRKA